MTRSWLPNNSRLGAALSDAMRREAHDVIPDEVDLWPQIGARLRSRGARGRLRGLLHSFTSGAGELPEEGTSNFGLRRPSWKTRQASAMMPLFMLLLVVWGMAAFLIGRQSGVQTRELQVYSGSDLAADASGEVMLARVLDTARLDELRLAGLLRDPQLHQEAGGCAARIKQVYADANRLIIGLTVNVPAAQRGEFRVYGGVMYAGGKVPALLYETTTSNATGTAARLLVYDLSLLNPTPSELKLRAIFSIVGQSSASEQQALCRNPFNFDLAVPVHTSDTRVLHLNRTISAAGETITLEKVVVTPLAAQAILRVSEGDDNVAWDLVAVDISFAGKDGSVTREHGSLFNLTGGRLSLELSQSDLTREGKWIVEVVHLQESSSEAPQTGFAPLRGPWIFEFEVPPQ